MGWWPRRRRSEGIDKVGSEANESPLEIGELEQPPWQAHAEDSAATTFISMARRFPSLIGQVLGLAWQANRRDTVITLTLNAAAGLFTAFALLSTTGVLTALFAAGPTPERVRAALPSLLLVGLATALRTAMSAGGGWAQARIGPQAERLVQRRLYALTGRVDLACFDDDSFHDALLRARDRGTMTVPWLVEATISVVSGLAGVAGAAMALFVLHPVLLPLLIISALPDGWAAVRSARMEYMATYALSASRRRKWVISDLLSDRPSAADIRSYTMDGFLLTEWDRVAHIEQDTQLDLARGQMLARISGDAVGGVATLGVYVALGALLAFGGMPLAVAGTAVLAIRTGQQSLQNLIYSVNRCYEEGLYFADYVEMIAQAKTRLPRVGRRHLFNGFNEISVRDVTFTYPGAHVAALRNVTIDIRKGEVIALVGENGSGKTTLAKILAGLYDPDSGTVFWDNTPFADVSPESLRERIAVIAQDYTRFPLSARTNITLRHPAANGGDDVAVRRAAEATGADQVIAELPHGYDSLLDRRFKAGVELSGGQWQRIAAARGLFRDAPLLITDEPTAALDARAEHALFEAIREHAEDRTVLLITHRLASVRMADRIYVLDHGSVVQQGTHASLIADGGIYAHLYQLQKRAFADDPAEDGSPSSDTEHQEASA